MTQHPAERIRNKFTPFLTLVELLTSEEIEIKTTDPALKVILNDVIGVCKENSRKIHKHLSDIEEFMCERSGIDYVTLSKEFNVLLNSKSKEDLEKWLEYDKQRIRDADENS